MFHLLLVLSVVGQAPKTFEAIEIEKIRTYHELKGFRETMKITVLSEAGKPEILRIIELDGDREHGVFELLGGAKMESVCDGTTKRLIMHSEKFYSDMAFEKQLASKSPELAKAEPDEVHFDFSSDGGQPVRFASSPQFELKSIEIVKEGTEKLRKVASFISKGPGRACTLTQWFLNDKWVLKRFKIEGTGIEGPLNVEGVAKLEFGVKFHPDTFKLNPKSVEGYRKVSGGRPCITPASSP